MAALYKMRSACARVARTADRPIPSGAVSVKQALAFLVFQALLGLLILLQLSPAAIGLGVLSMTAARPNAR